MSGKRIATVIIATGILLLSGCGGQSDTTLTSDAITVEQPNHFLRFLNMQASLAAGTYQIVAATYTPGSSGNYTLTVTGDDGKVHTVNGQWTSSGGRNPTAAGNPVQDVTLEQAGGLKISLDSTDTNAYLYLIRNGQVVAEDDNSGGAANALIDLPMTKIHNTDYSRAYYKAVDPSNERTTLADWKSVNNFGQGDCLHVIFRDTRDLGYGRNMHACRKANGDLAVYVKNYIVKVLPGDPGNYGPLNLPAAIAEQEEHHVGTNAIEFSADPNNPSERIAKFFTFAPDGTRNVEADLDGRGKKAVPQPCLLCHGADLHPLNPDGSFPEETLRSAKLNLFAVNSFGYADSGPWSRSGEADKLRRLNGFVHGVFAEMDSRPDNEPAVWDASLAMDIAEGHYHGDFSTGSYDANYVPPGWQQNGSRPDGVELLYKKVIEPHCIECHSLRGSRTGERISTSTRMGNSINFNSYENFIGYSDIIIDYVYKRGVMPLSLRNYNSFWSDPDGAPALLAGFLPGFDRYDSKGHVIKPGLPIARTGADRTVVSPVQLDGNRSNFVRSWHWQVVSAPAQDWTLDGMGTARPVLTAPTDGTYVIKLTVTNDRGSDSHELTLNVDHTLSPTQTQLTFTNDIVPILQDGVAGTREACTDCHNTSMAAGGAYQGIPVYYDSGNPNLYHDVMTRVDLADPENSILLRKPTREQHGGGVVIDRSTVDGEKVYETIVKWIRNGAVCGTGSYCP